MIDVQETAWFHPGYQRVVVASGGEFWLAGSHDPLSSGDADPAQMIPLTPMLNGIGPLDPGQLAEIGFQHLPSPERGECTDQSCKAYGKPIPPQTHPRCTSCGQQWPCPVAAMFSAWRTACDEIQNQSATIEEQAKRIEDLTVGIHARDVAMRHLNDAHASLQGQRNWLLRGAANSTRISTETVREAFGKVFPHVSVGEHSLAADPTLVAVLATFMHARTAGISYEQAEQDVTSSTMDAARSVLARMDAKIRLRAQLDGRPPWGKCGVCRTRVHFVEQTFGGVWVHDKHPLDGHDPDPEKFDPEACTFDGCGGQVHGPHASTCPARQPFQQPATDEQVWDDASRVHAKFLERAQAYAELRAAELKKAAKAITDLLTVTGGPADDADLGEWAEHVAAQIISKTGLASQL